MWNKFFDGDGLWLMQILYSFIPNLCCDKVTGTDLFVLEPF